MNLRLCQKAYGQARYSATAVSIPAVFVRRRARKARHTAPASQASVDSRRGNQILSPPVAR